MVLCGPAVDWRIECKTEKWFLLTKLIEPRRDLWAQWLMV